jgi:hypothetical protein
MGESESWPALAPIFFLFILLALSMADYGTRLLR